MQSDKLKVTDKETGAWVEVFSVARKAAGDVVYCARGFRPKGKNHAFYYHFKSAPKRDEYVSNFFKSVKEHKASVAKARADRVQPNKLQVGHVLVCTWGYDQTNVDYFEVTKVISNSTVEIREIAQSYEETGFMCGKTYPKIGEYKGEPMRKRVLYGNRVRIYSFATAGIWDTKPDYSSHYA